MFILHDNPMVGIYRIKNLVNNKCYYGSSKEVRKRYTLMSEDEKKEKHSKPMETNPNWRGGESFKYCKCGVKIAPINNSCINCIDKSGIPSPTILWRINSKNKKYKNYQYNSAIKVLLSN